jgi:cell division septum initiation protein DivIVA
LASSADVPEFETAGIVGHTFAGSRHGYSREEVDRYLRVIDDHVARLQTELAWHRARSDHLSRRETAAEEAAYGRLSRQFADVLRTADQSAARIQDEAEQEARDSVARAQEEASKIVESAVGRAREEAAGILEAALARREAVLETGRNGNGARAADYVDLDLTDLDMEIPQFDLTLDLPDDASEEPVAPAGT